MTIDGHTYTSAEQYYQQKKAEENQNDSLAQQILSTNDPARQKFLGNKTKLDDQVWRATGLVEMYRAFKAKFDQNPHLKAYLLATNNLPLGEASSNMFWGIGSTLQNPQSLVAGSWTGNNNLGHILMRVRSELKQ